MKLIRAGIVVLLLVALTKNAAGQQFVDSLNHLISKTESDTHRVTLYNVLAKYYNDRSDSTALKLSRAAIRLSKEKDYERGLAQSYASYATAIGNTGNFTEEIVYHNKALTLFEKLKDTDGQAKELGNLAIADWNMGDYPTATDHCLQSIRLYEKSGDKFGAAVSQMSLGNIYFDQKNYTEAIRCYKEARRLNNITKKMEGFDAAILTNLGNIYNKRKQYDSALVYYNQGLDYFTKHHQQLRRSVLLNNIGTIYEDQGRYDDALGLFRESYNIRSTMGDSDGVCSVFQNLGNVYTDKKQYDSAMYFYNRAMALANWMKSKSQMVTVYSDLATMYEQMGNFEQAYRMQEKYIALNDSLTGAENQEAVNSLREKYNAEKREQQITELEKAGQLEHERNMMILLAVVLGAALLVAIFYIRYRAKMKTAELLERKNIEITLQKNSITDSINYAKKIQDSILPPDAHIHRILPDSFILYEPKDVVSGDFYWVEQHEGLSIFAAVDCTGHGVPGALMSVVGFNLLNQAVNEHNLTKPSDILHHLDYGVNKLLRQSDEGNTVKDGMDLALCTYNPQTRELQYAGVFNPAYIVSRGQFMQVKADKFPIGINVDGVTDNYTNNTVQLYPGDMVYLFSDGYADQFGGATGKKYKYNRFRDLLMKIWMLPVEEQKNYLRREFIEWKGNLEQVDDILVIGVRIN